MPNPPRKMGRPRGFNTKSTPTTIQALDRALDVLETLSVANGLTLSELAEELDQSPATMHRVLGTLEARGIVETDAQDQTWHIGAAAFRLGSSFLRRSSIAERSRPVMRELMEHTGETSNLGIAQKGEVMFISQIETHESIRAFFPPGTLSPMHASGIGKALLSCFGEMELDRFFRQQDLVNFTAQTITEEANLRADLELIRARGWSFDNEEKTEGMRCIAAPIRNIYGEAVAGISISGPANRLPDQRIAAIGTSVREAAKRISQGLGAPIGQEQ